MHSSRRAMDQGTGSRHPPQNQLYQLQQQQQVNQMAMMHAQSQFQLQAQMQMMTAQNLAFQQMMEQRQRQLMDGFDPEADYYSSTMTFRRNGGLRLRGSAQFPDGSDPRTGQPPRLAIGKSQVLYHRNQVSVLWTVKSPLIFTRLKSNVLFYSNAGFSQGLGGGAQFPDDSDPRTGQPIPGGKSHVLCHRIPCFMHCQVSSPPHSTKNVLFYSNTGSSQNREEGDRQAQSPQSYRRRRRQD